MYDLLAISMGDFAAVVAAGAGGQLNETALTHIVMVGGLVIPLVVIWLDLRYRQTALHDKTKQEREAEAKKVADAIRERDNKLLFTLNEYPLHRHDEDAESAKAQPLTTDGLKYPKLKINGS